MAPLPPLQFPCLVKAIYSFAGQSKGDLGFVQGDLIECLNTGDGQWWFGRLKRNKAMGSFPCNYVELVDDRPSSKGSKSSAEQSRPSSSQSHIRPQSRLSLRSPQCYGQDLNINCRPSSSCSYDRRPQLHMPRSMTSIAQPWDHYPSRSQPSPVPSFYSGHSRHTAFDNQDDDLNYPVDDIGYTQDYQAARVSINSRPQTPSNLPPSMRQTPSPLRWAMQSLMDSLDHINPPLSQESYGQFDDYDGQGFRHAAERADSGWRPDAGVSPEPSHLPNPEMVPPYVYPADMRPPQLLNYVDKMESRLQRFQNYHYSPQQDDGGYVQERSPSRLASSYNSRPASSYSVDKPLPVSPSIPPPMPPPHMHRHRDTESLTSYSTKQSIFSSAASDYSTATSSISSGSAGSAGSFARKKAQQQRKEQVAPNQRTALGVLPKFTTNTALKRRKSYGSSLKKTIGKLLSTSPTKPPPGTVTDHGDKIIEWQNVRRDVNRANTPSLQERTEQRERLEMSEGLQVIRPIQVLGCIIEGDESANGSPIPPDEAFDISKVNFSLIDRATRLVNQIPPQYLCSPASFAKAVICRPYASEIQRLRAIFVFLAEKFTWEPLHAMDAFENESNAASLQRLFETRRGTSEDVAWCFWEMCQGCNIHAQVIAGHLKSPFHDVDVDIMPQQNHFWNAVIVNGEWRMVDASLASPTHPNRPPPSSKSFDPFYFLTRPSEFLYTHVPLGNNSHQHVLSQDIVYPAIQLALPYACPAYFLHDLALQSDFDISQTRLDGLQVACIDIEVPEDVECVAEVESQIYARDLEGDLFESGEVSREPALAQPLWSDEGQRKMYRIKGFLNGEGAKGILKIYAGKRGLMTSAQDNPHRLALTIPLSQSGTNSPFHFVTRHPTPNAQRHDIYIRQPQCKELRLNQTYVFSVLQNPSSSSASESKPAKLAIQMPGGKLVKLSNRAESDRGPWEALTKCGERGSWKGLILGATSRWCVFAEWECVG